MSDQNTDEKSGLKFLVVDDDSAVRRTVVEFLSSFGYVNVVEADDGYDALALIKGGSIDFVISDWEMPSLNGIEFLKELRKTPSTSHIPFIMITSPVSHEKMKVEEAALSEVDAYIIKPFRAKILQAKIGDILSKKALPNCKGALVIDDDDLARSTVVEILETLGYDPIYQAQDGEEGFNTLKQNRGQIAIVVSDWEMPKLAGIDLLKRIREDSVLSETPFIMVTSQSSMEHIKVNAAIQAEVDHYLMKPFTVEDLKKKINSLFQRAKQKQDQTWKMDRAEQALTENDPEYAERLYKQVISSEPKNVDAYLGLARTQLHSKPKVGYDDAIQYIKLAINANPVLAKPYIELALIYEKAMSLEKAVNCLRDGIKNCPPNEHLHFHVGRLLIRHGRAEAGRAELKKAIELNAKFDDAQDLLKISAKK